jgi:hypothetical protein
MLNIWHIKQFCFSLCLVVYYSVVYTQGQSNPTCNISFSSYLVSFNSSMLTILQRIHYIKQCVSLIQARLKLIRWKLWRNQICTMQGLMHLLICKVQTLAMMWNFLITAFHRTIHNHKNCRLKIQKLLPRWCSKNNIYFC